MALWEYDEKDLLEDTTNGNWIGQSGCYEAEIELAEIVNSNDTRAQAVALTFTTTKEEKARVTLWYRGKEGGVVDFIKRLLNQICYLSKTTASNLKPETRQIGEKQKTVIPQLLRKSIGIFLKVKINTNGDYEYTLEGVYEPKSKRTPKEIQTKSDSIIYGKMLKKYSSVNHSDENKDFLGEEFPF